MLLDANGEVVVSSERAIFKEIATMRESDVLGFLSRLPHPSRILKSRADIWELYDKVAEQLDIDAVIDDYKSGIAAMEEDVVCASNPTSKQAQFFTRYIQTVNTKQWRRIACEARDYGCTFVEVTKWGEFENAVVPIEIKSKPRKWFGFDSDGNAKYYPKGTSNGIPLSEYPNNFITLRYKDSLLNPYGAGKLDRAYYIALGLNGIVEFMMTFLEEDGRDKWIFRHPESASLQEIQRGLENARRLRQSGVGAISENSSFEQKDVKGRSSTSEAYKIADEILSSKVLKAWFGTDLLQQKDGKGGYAQTESGMELRGEALLAGIELSQELMHGVFNIIKNINALPDEKDHVEYRLYHARSTSKEEAEMYQVYFAMGEAKPTEAFFTNRGIPREEYEFKPETGIQGMESDSSQSTETFAAADDVAALTSAFEAYWGRVKKKD